MDKRPAFLSLIFFAIKYTPISKITKYIIFVIASPTYEGGKIELKNAEKI